MTLLKKTRKKNKKQKTLVLRCKSGLSERMVTNLLENLENTTQSKSGQTVLTAFLSVSASPQLLFSPLLCYCKRQISER